MRFTVFLAFLLPALAQSFGCNLFTKQLQRTSSACGRAISLSMKVGDPNREHDSILSSPVNVNTYLQRDRKKYFNSAMAALFTSSLFSKSVKAEVNREETLYTDVENGFSVLRLPGWKMMPKQPPTITPQKFQPEEVLFVASSFLEGNFCWSS